MMTLVSLIDLTKRLSLTFDIRTPSSSNAALPPFNASSTSMPDVLFILNFATAQRSALLASPHTLALLYTPANEHFGIVPIEAMISGLPVLACDSGGPTESVVDPDFLGTDEKAGRTGWLRTPEPEKWAIALQEIVRLPQDERAALGERARTRATDLFGMDAMASSLEDALKKAVAMGSVPGPGLLLLALPVLVLLLSILVLRKTF
jgi:alpha-1,3/alpha-1,6-mannosyltransferase